MATTEAGVRGAWMRKMMLEPGVGASTGDGGVSRTDVGEMERAASRGCVQRDEPPRGLRIGLVDE